MQPTPRRLEKKDLYTLLFLVFIFHLANLYLLNHLVLNVTISCVTLAVSLLIILFKTVKQPQTEKALNWIYGVVGIINAFSFEIAFAFSLKAELKYQLLSLALAVSVIIAIIFLMKFLYKRSLRHSSNTKYKKPNTTIISIASTMGAVIGMWLLRTEIIPKSTLKVMLLGIIGIIFATFSSFLFKSKDCE